MAIKRAILSEEELLNDNSPPSYATSSPTDIHQYHQRILPTSEMPFLGPCSDGGFDLNRVATRLSFDPG